MEKLFYATIVSCVTADQADTISECCIDIIELNRARCPTVNHVKVVIYSQSIKI